MNKDAASSALSLLSAALEYLSDASTSCTAEEIAVAIGQADRIETVYRMLRRKAAPQREAFVSRPPKNPSGTFRLGNYPSKRLALAASRQAGVLYDVAEIVIDHRDRAVAAGRQEAAGVGEEGHRRDVMTGVPVTPCFLRIREFRAREAVLAVDCRVGVQE